LKYWWEEPLVVIQTNLQVADTPLLQPEKLMQQIKDELRGDVVVFNAGGIYAWYPTKIPFHNINPFMNGRDVLREALESAHKEGLKFIARISIGIAEEWIYHWRPEWFVKDEEGKPILVGEPRPGNWGLLYQTCPNSPYQREEVAFKIYEELIDNYDIDGFFITFLGFPRACYCGYCREKYLKEMKKPLPINLARGSLEWQEYVQWQEHCVIEVFQSITDIVRKKRPELLITGEFGGGSYTPYDLCKLCNVLSPNVTDRVGELQPPRWIPSVQTKYARNVIGGIPPWSIIAPAPGLTWRHSSLPEGELLFWLSQIPANGGHIWHALTGIPDTQKDKRLLRVISDVDKDFDKIRQYLKEVKPVSQIAVLESRQTLIRYAGSDSLENYLSEVYGFYDALMAGHLQFTPIPDEQLTDEILSKYKVLILPNSACLSKEQIDAIRRFVNNGGSIIGSFEVSLYDESGGRRGNFALSEEFGVDFIDTKVENLIASYMRIQDSTHPVVESFQDTEILPLDTKLLRVKSHNNAKVILTYIPPFATKDGVGAPPERATLPFPYTDIPLMLVLENNNSRNVYFATKIGTLLWKLKILDHRKLIISAVKWALGSDINLKTDAPSEVYVTMFETESHLLLNLVNGVGERPLGEIVPIHNITIEVRQSENTHIESVYAVLSDRELGFQVKDNWTRFTIPELNYWEVIAIKRSKN
jgi:hypothetical protein